MTDILKQINDSIGLKPASQPAGRPVSILDEIDAGLKKNRFDKPGRKFRVTNVLDGDTLDLEGFGRVRLAGINTPETVDPRKGVEVGGPEASAFLKKLATGKSVTVKLQAGDAQDKYGRHLAAIEDEDGRVFNIEVIRSGHSKQIKEIPESAPVTTPQPGRLWRSATTAMQIGLTRGLLYPVSSFFANDWKLLQRSGDRARRDLLQELDSRGAIDPSVRDKVAMAPEIVGELIGGLPANVSTYMAFRGTFGVTKAATMVGKAGRSIAASSASAVSISTLAHIDDGESRFARMARDAAIGGAFEVIGLPLMRKAWRNEIGEKVADAAVGNIARDTGVAPDVVASHIDALRSGNLGADIAIAERLSAELAKNETAAKSILKLNADRAVADWYNDVLATRVVVDESYFLMDSNFGVQGTLKIRNPSNGEEQLLPFHIKSQPGERPTQPGEISQTKFITETRMLRDTALGFKRQGFEVKLEEAHVGKMGAWSRFHRGFRGADMEKPPVPNAKKGTLASRAERPVAGRTYRDAVTGQKVTVLGSEQPWDDFEGIEARIVTKAAPGSELAHAVAIAKAEGDEAIVSSAVKEIDNRVKAYHRNLDVLEQQSDKGLAELDVMLAQATKTAPEYAAVRARVTAQMKERNVKRPTPISTPKGIQGPLTKFEEGPEDGIEAQLKGTRSNEWGVAGYERRTGTNQLVDFMRKAKAMRGQARDVRQGVRDDARRLRDEWAALRDEDHARVVGTAQSLEAERSALAERVSAEEALPVPQGMPGYEPDKWAVKVVDERGTIHTRTLDKIFLLAQIESPRSIAHPLGLKPHSDGSVRHGLIDLQSKTAHLEDFDRPSQWWQAPESTMIDEEDYLIGHQPRVFMHPEGVTISIPNTQNFDQLADEWRTNVRTAKLGAKVEDVGPRDTIEAAQHAKKVFSSGPKEYTPVDVGSGLQSKIEQKLVTSGGEVKGRLQIRQSATPVRYYDPQTQSYKTRPRSEYDMWETFAGKPDEVVGNRPFPAGFTPRKATRAGVPGEYHEVTPPRVLERIPSTLLSEDVTIRPASFAITKDAAEKHLEMVTAKKAAQVLIAEGADPSTSVRLTVSGAQFESVEAPFEWTLDELSKFTFSPAKWDTIQDVARSRGFRAIMDGEKVVLGGQGGQYTFPSGQEAISFLLQIPRGKKYSPIIEKKLLQAWAVGGPDRSTDAVVDGLRFRGTQVQESSITEVVTGKSPVTVVQSTNGGTLDRVVKALAQQSGTVGDFAAIPVDGVFLDKAHDLKQFIVYSKAAVRARINQHQEALRKIGIDPRQGETDVMMQLHDYGRGSGLHLLIGNRNPADVLLYAQLRQWNQPEMFRQGGLQSDVHGQFRTFSPDQRKAIGQQLLENPPNPIYDPSVASRLERAGLGRSKALGESLGGPPDLKELLSPPDSPLEGGGGSILDSLAPIGAGGDDLRPPIGELTTAAEEEYLSSSRTFRLSDFFRVPMELFKEYQEATGIPFYRWWQSIDHGRTQVVRATHPLFNQIHVMARGLNREQKVQVGQLFELRYSDEAAHGRLQEQFPEIVQKGEALLDSVMRKFVGDLGLDPEAELRAIPFFRRMNADNAELRPYNSSRPPEPITRKSRSFADELPLDEREYDFSITMKRYGRALAHEKHLAQEWKEIDKSIRQLAGTESDHSVQLMIDFFNRHRAEAVHAQDRLGYGLAMGVRNITKRLTGIELAHEEAMDVVGTLTGANYLANMGFNIGMTARNYLQTLQTVYPVMGGADTVFGIRMALRWRKDPKIRTAMEERDIINTNAMLEPLSNVQQALLESDKLSKYAAGAGKVVDVMNKGVQFYQSADDFNRVASYYAQYNAAERAGKKFLSGKIDWAEYLFQSKAELRDVRKFDPVTQTWRDGELLTQVKQLLGAGENEKAAHLLALDFAKASQFLYSRGNVPYVMQSTAGRLFGQYGTWPAWYAEWFGNNLFRRGSRRSQVQFASRWAAVNVTMFYGMAEVFGVDFARWSFFAPLVYTGGPMYQVAQQAVDTLSAKVSGDEDAVARIQAARLQGSAWKQFVPFPTIATSHTVQAVEQLRDGNYPDAMRRLFGLPEVKP